jgi:hypothetical protein
MVAIDGSKFRACNSRRKNFTKRKIEYQEYYDRADKLFAENIEFYKQRQMIVEHIISIIFYSSPKPMIC